MFANHLFSRQTLVACAIFGALAATLPADDSLSFGPWSTPAATEFMNINTTAGEFFPFESKNGLSLYVTLNVCPFGRPAANCTADDEHGFGGFDIYVAHRDSRDQPWGRPQNLGSAINTPYNDQAVSLTHDGHLMFIASDRPGGVGGNDLYVSRRHHVRDDFDWSTPVNVGAEVNSTSNEANPEIFVNDLTGQLELYFDSNRKVCADGTSTCEVGDTGFGPYTDDATAHNGNDIYVSLGNRGGVMSAQGNELQGVFSAPTLLRTLSTAAIDRSPTVRRDGLELLMVSARGGGIGGYDIWMSTRPHTAAAWSTPVNLGATVNSSSNDAGPALTFDGRSLILQSARPGGAGLYDLYRSTRTTSGS